MPIIKTQFKETSAKRNVLQTEKIKLGKFKNDISITDVKEIKGMNAQGAKGVIFDYTFKTDYSLEEPKNSSLGAITVTGELYFVEKEGVIDDILKEWKKNKKLKEDLLKSVLNVAFENAQIEALEQSKKVGLPPPVPLIRLKK